MLTVAFLKKKKVISGANPPNSCTLNGVPLHLSWASTYIEECAEVFTQSPLSRTCDHKHLCLLLPFRPTLCIVGPALPHSLSSRR